MPIKRLRYFDKQFLVEKDFTDEQKYHLEMRRRLNRLLNAPGIAEGLAVEKTANKEVTVHPGTAIDAEGREMILEGDQAIDLSNPVKFPPETEVSVTISYEEEETDESTSTVPGKTRITEKAKVDAVSGSPPVGAVVLARFKLDAGGNVGGAIGDILPGGPNVQSRSGLLSIDQVSNPGGNIDLAQAGAITILPDNNNKRITIGENHSTRTNNPHNVTAAQIGAMLAGEYDLERRATANILFTQGDASGATRTINVGFLPRIVFVVGTSTASLAGRSYGGGVGAFAVINEAPTILFQRCFGFGVTRSSNTDWFVRGFAGSGICLSTFFNQEVNPNQAENLTVSITNVSSTGLTATLVRALPNVTNVVLPNFAITLQLLCLGNVPIL